MRQSQLLRLLLLTLLCLAVSGMAEAGEAGHPEQFPYPDSGAGYFDSKTGCLIEVNEHGAFRVHFPNGLNSSSIIPATPCAGVTADLYDPTTMSNTAKKIVSTQTSYLDLQIGCSGYQVPSSSMTGSADAKKAKVMVKINDSSLENAIYTPGSIRPQSDGYHEVLLSAGFKLKLGTWTATCSAKRSLEE